MAHSDRGMWDVPVQQFSVKETESLTPPEGKFLAAVNVTVSVKPVFSEGPPEKVGKKKEPPDDSLGDPKYILFNDARRRLRGSKNVMFLERPKVVAGSIPRDQRLSPRGFCSMRVRTHWKGHWIRFLQYPSMRDVFALSKIKTTGLQVPP